MQLRLVSLVVVDGINPTRVPAESKLRDSVMSAKSKSSGSEKAAKEGESKLNVWNQVFASTASTVKTKVKRGTIPANVVVPILDLDGPDVVFIKTNEDADRICTSVMRACSDASIEFNKLCQLDADKLVGSFAKKHTNKESLDTWMESFVGHEMNLGQINAAAFQTLRGKKGDWEEPNSFVYNERVDRIINALLNVDHSRLKKVESLLCLTKEVYDHLKTIDDKTLEVLMSKEKNGLVGWNRAAHGEVRFVKGKRWAYTLYLMGMTIPFGSKNIPIVGTWIREVFKYVKKNQTSLSYDGLRIEVECLFQLIFGCVMNLQVCA